MIKKLSVVVSMVFVLALFFVTPSNAIQITIDTDNLDKTTASTVLEAQKQAKKIAEKAKTPSVDQMEAWANIGEKIGKAISATCRELGVEVNKFVKTPVGKIAMALIVWKVVGQEAWAIIGGTLSWFVISLMIMWSFSHFHMRKKLTDKEHGERYIATYEFKGEEAKICSAIAHAVAFAVITMVCLLIVF